MSEEKPSKLHNILNEVISEKLNSIEAKIIQRLIRIQIPYFLLIFMSFLFAFSFPLFVSQYPPLFYIVPVIPVGAFIYFNVLSNRARRDLKEEVKKTDSSESEITRIIDKYSGIVDAIGTALPLIGAAILLGIVGSGIKGDKFDQYFTGFAVPFEVISILVLASAKLYESVFDELSLNYQEVTDLVKSTEKKYYHDEQIKAIESIRNENIESKEIQLPALTAEEHEQIRKTYTLMNSLVDGLKNETVSKTIEQLLLLTSKDKNNNQ